MSNKLIPVLASLCLGLSIFAGLLGYQLKTAKDRARRLELQKADVRDELDAKADETKALRRELSSSESLAKRLRERIAELGKRPTSAAALASASHDENTEDAASEASAKSAPERGGEPYVLESFDEADALVQDFLEKGDLQSIWLLGADLLAYGEPGYDKILELAKIFDDKEAVEDLFKDLWREEEMIIGPFLRTVAENSEELLRFQLHLDGKDPASMPGMLQEFHREFDDELGGIILGYDGLEDDQLRDAYMQRFRQRLAPEGLADERRARDLIRNLSQMPSEEAVDLLLDLAGRVPKKLLPTVLRSLAWQRSPRAIPLLRELSTNSSDPETASVAQAALQHIGE